MSRHELDDIFRAGTARAPQQGDTQGTLIFPGTKTSYPLAVLASLFVWQGKVFNCISSPDGGTLVNKVTPFGLRSVAGKFAVGRSWLDANDAIIIDYRETSFIAQYFRDEIREIQPGIFLGKVWWGGIRAFDFALVQSAPSA